MKKKPVILGAVALAFIIAGGIVFNRSKTETVSPKRGDILEAIYALGKVKARRQYEIKVGVLSSVEKIHVHEGDHVKAQSPLLKLVDSGVFRAPFAGVVTLISVDEGAPVAPNFSILRLEDLSDKYIEVSLEQQGALRVAKGQAADVVFESLRGEKFKGRVTTLFARNDEFLAHIEVEGGMRPNILPGMTADIAITVEKHADALLIPVNAVNNGYVLIQRDGKRLKLPVQLGAIDGQMAQVTSGDFRESDQIVIGKKK